MILFRGNHSRTHLDIKCPRSEPCIVCWRCKNYSTRDIKCINCYPRGNACVCDERRRTLAMKISKIMGRQSFHPQSPKQRVMSTPVDMLEQRIKMAKEGGYNFDPKDFPELNVEEL